MIFTTFVISLFIGYLLGKFISDKRYNNEIDAKKYRHFKLALVVRTDLGMTKGKIAAQCGHATLACYKVATRTNPAVVRAWESSRQAKVALKCDGEDKLLELQAIAQSLSLPAQSIRDAGSYTVLGIGPGPVELVDQVTGKLKLL